MKPIKTTARQLVEAGRDPKDGGVVKMKLTRDVVRDAAQFLLMHVSGDDLRKLIELDDESNRAWLQGGTSWQLEAQKAQRDHIDAMVDKIHDCNFKTMQEVRGF